MVVNRNNLDYIRDTLYTLKRDYGNPIDLYHKITVPDYQTGKKKTTRTKHTIKKAIILPINMIAVAGAVKAAAPGYGSMGIDIADRVVVLDAKDLKGIEIQDDNWYFVLDHHRYEITSIRKFDMDLAYVFTLKETEGAEVGENPDGIAKQELELQQQIRVQYP